MAVLLVLVEQQLQTLEVVVVAERRQPRCLTAATAAPVSLS
jgi:hypothetical protein